MDHPSQCQVCGRTLGFTAPPGHKSITPPRRCEIQIREFGLTSSYETEVGKRTLLKLVTCVRCAEEIRQGVQQKISA